MILPSEGSPSLSLLLPSKPSRQVLPGVMTAQVQDLLRPSDYTIGEKGKFKVLSALQE